MAETKIPLSDKVLFPFCVKHIKTLDFLSEYTQKVLKKLANKVQKGSLTSSDGNGLVELWENLVTDAVHALKAHDEREKASAQRGHYQYSDEKARTTTRCQNVYGSDSLFRFFREFTGFEQLLYGTEQHYRDHVAHPIRVWMTGVKIITEWGGIMHLDFGEVKEVGKIGEIEKWAAWTIIALCHDLGYPLEKAHKVTDQVDKMMEFFGNISTGRYRYSFQVHHQPLIDIMLRSVASKLTMLDVKKDEARIVGDPPAIAVNSPDHEASQKPSTGAELDHDSSPLLSADRNEGNQAHIFTTVVQPKYYAKFSHSFEQFQHGIISVLVLLRSLVYFMEMDFDFSGHGSLKAEDARQFHIRREILRSIAVHTCPEVYHLRLNTPSFLLIVCDDLQEWGRPTVASMRLEPASFAPEDAGEDAEVCIESCTLESGQLSCRISYPPHGKGEEKVKSEFRRYHKLLRAALGDEQRKFVFSWEVACREVGGTRSVTLLFSYDSSKPPFEELSITRNGKQCTSSLFDDKPRFSYNDT